MSAIGCGSEGNRAIVSAVAEGDAHDVSPLLECDPADVERWNNEWLAYLGREWALQLAPHTDIPNKPPLPCDPLELIPFSLGPGWSMALYCDAASLQNRRVMELGCGCGNLGKQLGRYVSSYLGVDFSTMALQIARLVSPDNCTYVHVSDLKELKSYYGIIDTVVGRYFWIHQNFELGRQNLRFLERFLRPGGRLYADFFWPDEAQEHFVVLSPRDALSKIYPSAMFRYTLDDVRQLIEGYPFRIIRETISGPMERRYVVLERT